MTYSSATVAGILYIVATPIGNLRDISLRALDTLQAVDTILAEDTRHSLKLLTALGIHKPLLSLHSQNETERSVQVIAALKTGKSFAMISDAGTPLISDPGFALVRLARKHAITVCPIPGPCAFIAALSAAGVPCECFTFAGFLPTKSLARRNKLQTLNHEYTSVVYESTHRISACIKDIIFIFGDRFEFVLAKELTKAYERFIIGTGMKIMAWLEEDSSHAKGEFVLILPPRALDSKSNQHNTQAILDILLKELPLKQAVKLATLLTKLNKNELYKLALSLRH